MTDRQTLLHLLSALDIEAEICRRSLYEFAKRAWHVLEPGKPFVDGWHIHAICEHLQAVSEGQISRLLINVPPRHMKSLLVSVLWPVWDWLRNPSRQFLTASYRERLAIRDALKSRRVIQSTWFQARFGDAFSMQRDQNEKTRYENTHMGHRILMTPAGGVGEGGDILIADDPQNSIKMDSDAYIEATTEWWNVVFSTRLNGPTSAMVLTMQRLSASDLSSVALETGGWEHLMLPAEFERARACSTSIFKDPRTEEGQLLWPEFMPLKRINELKASLKEYGTAGQLQQRPAPRGGGILKRAHYKFIKRKMLPKFFAHYISFDTAASDNEANDPTGATVWGLSNEAGKEGVFKLGQLEEYLTVPELHKRVPAYAKQWPAGTILIIEEAGPSGKGLIQQLKAARSGLPIVAYRPTLGKTERARLASTYLEQGKVWLIEDDPDNEYFLSMSDAFPKSKPRDVVDSAIQAWLYLFSRYTFESVPESAPSRFKYIGGGGARKS
ncbi:hypothetical protein DZC30_02455 [Comamonas testosteroni]|uniref:Terminase large subunit gp17-like C-terminal domain-containing protein n=1 Tax=Comamonas testosteroni TaxID=285 RepID=A0A373FS08_COMTE|nr:hypothetical protein [Comamonas testosteroni]RGE46657.1 hypothetical protein DZC30_02455 [Comamonas testosteroni]